MITSVVPAVSQTNLYVERSSSVRKYTPKAIKFAEKTEEITSKDDADQRPANQNIEEQPEATEPVKKRRKERDSELERLSPITSERLAKLQQQLPKKKPKFSVKIEDSSESSNESTSSSSNGDFPIMGSHQGIGLGIHDKPLPEIPISLAERARQTTLDKFLRRKQAISSHDSSSKLSVPRQLSFSFQPGDDVAILSPGLETDRIKRHTIESHLDQVSRHDVPPKSTTPLGQRSPQKGNPTTKSTSTQPNIRPRLGNPKHLPKDLHDYEDMKREDSTSSVITAVRDNSGRSSVASGSRNNRYTSRPKVDRNTGDEKNGSAGE